jgi:hypothetical protein
MKRKSELKVPNPHRSMRAYGLKRKPGNGFQPPGFRGDEKTRSRLRLREPGKEIKTCTCYLRIFSINKYI